MPVGEAQALKNAYGAGKTTTMRLIALYVEVCGLFAFDVGALVRNTAGALTLAYGCLALLPPARQGAARFLAQRPDAVGAGR
jgi:hypothetical protein